MPKLNELSAKHADQGLVLIGVHSKRKGESMPAFVTEHGIQYPVAWDSTGALAKAFAVDGYPDYQVIDRAGNVRVADLANGEVEKAIKLLLAEPVPSTVPAALASAAADAQKKDTRILGVFGNDQQRSVLTTLAKTNRELGTFLRYEYQVTELDATEHAELLVAAGVDGTIPSLVAYTAGGKALAARPIAGLDEAGLDAFLREHQVPQKDAEALWAAALEEAKRDKKRILVHLGAPW